MLSYVSSLCRSRRDVCISAGPYGGGGGGEFNELLDNCNAIVSSIFIRSGSFIDAIQFTYRYSSGSYHIGNHNGGYGGGGHTIHIDVEGGERLTGVFGQSGSKIDRLGFITNWSRIYGPFGGCGGGPFTVSSCIVKGIFGRSGSNLDRIGFHCSGI